MVDKRYWICKEQGICVKCRKAKAIEGKVMCAKCAEKCRAYKRENREWAKEKGLCPRCLKNRLIGDEKICPECLAYMYSVNRKSRIKNYGSDHNYYVMDIARLKESGICRSCRKNKVAQGHTYCQSCLVKKRAISKKYRQLQKKDYIPRSERRSYGLCYRCGKPNDTDKGLCSECSESVAKNFKGIRGTNAYWQADNRMLGRS